MQRQGVNVEVSLDGVHGIELNVEEEEDKSVQSWTQAITETSDSCYHPLDHTCRGGHRWLMLLIITADTVRYVSADTFSWQRIDFTAWLSNINFQPKNL